MSILNEDEHGIKPEGGVAYTKCYDAVVKQLEAINSTIIPVGEDTSCVATKLHSNFKWKMPIVSERSWVIRLETGGVSGFDEQALRFLVAVPIRVGNLIICLTISTSPIMWMATRH